MPGNPLVRFDEGRVGRTARCRLLSYSTVIIVFEAVDNARDALFEERYVEVDQQPKTLVGEPEIGQKHRPPESAAGAPCAVPDVPVHTPRPYRKRIPASPGPASYECGKRVDDLLGNGVLGHRGLFKFLG